MFVSYLFGVVVWHVAVAVVHYSDLQPVSAEIQLESQRRLKELV